MFACFENGTGVRKVERVRRGDVDCGDVCVCAEGGYGRICFDRRGRGRGVFRSKGLCGFFSAGVDGGELPFGGGMGGFDEGLTGKPELVG